MCAGMLKAPESPRWLEGQGAYASAQAVATQLWGPQGVAELGAAKTSPAGASGAGAQETASIGDMFGSKYGKTVTMGIILFAIQQFAGINALVYFSTSVFRQVREQRIVCGEHWVCDAECVRRAS